MARAFVRQAPILILDEPMTGLDVDSEARVREALDRLMAGKTCLIITHDPTLAAQADRILRLEAGQVFDVPRLDASPTAKGSPSAVGEAR